MISCINAYSQSNKGTEFWTSFMLHNNGVTGATGASMILYITSDISTTGSVEIGGNLLKNFTVTANAVTFINIPASAYLNGFGKFTNSGIHITSAKPIAVYAHIYASSVSGATLLLPVNAMGKDYISLNYTQNSNARNTNPAFSTFNIIATEDNTTVSITPSVQLLDGTPAGVAYTILLNKGQVYQGLASADLTGTKIQSISSNTGTCKKIAVFSGSSRIGIGCAPGPNNTTFSSDNLFQQVYPTSTWGKNYIAAPLSARPFDIYRIVLSTPNTTVTLNGTQIPASLFINNLYFEFNSTSANVISADQPIQVVQYSPTQNQTLNCTSDRNNGDVGDPEMIYLSPIEQGLNHVTLYSTGYYAILQSYVNVVIPTTAINSFTLDGLPYKNSFKPIANSTYSYAQIAVTSGPQANNNSSSVTSGTHTIDAAVPFNAIAYGFGLAESYGYAAGTNLQDLNEYVALQDLADTTAILTTGCSNITYKLEVTIPFQTTNIAWKIDGTPTLVDTNPVVTSTTVKDGKTLYTYRYANPVNFASGTHITVATVFNPIADVCGTNQDVENGFTITDPPASDFSVAASTCLSDSVSFTDKTILTTGSTVKSWLWDFGDNTTSTLQNPKHKYAVANNYVVHLTTTDYNGCTNVSAAKTVHLIPNPVAAFTISTPDCPGQTLTFNSSASHAAEGTITNWAWDFGDSTKTALANGLPITHSYTKPGAYTVTLTVTTDGGCVSDIFTKVLTINPLPVADFTLPDICLHDPYAQFTSTSTIADSTESAFVYLWDFGDAATGNLNTSTLQNPRHVYHTQGNYTAKLTVTSKYGCVSSVSKSFAVTGFNPMANFSTQNGNNLCSSDSVTFVDASTVDFGDVSKLVFFYDFDNHPTDSVIYDRTVMRSDKKYTHFYGVNNTTTAKNYHVVLHAYSGQTCWSPYQSTIIINPSPIVSLLASDTATFNNPIALCAGVSPVHFLGQSNIPGKDKFTGKGITTDGLFDPSISGPGTFTINYLFTANNTGCTYTTSFQIIVYPRPTVTLPAEYIVLEGGQITISATIKVESGGFSYKWTPSVGLSSDKVINPVVTVTTDTRYTLTVIPDNTCATVVQTIIKVLKIPVIPNAFTPNGDGINDTWEIKYLSSYPNVTVEIFNRYGNKVFFSNGYVTPWDGRFNGGDLPVGTYYYIISPNSGRKPITGYLTIIR
jgi:gliding motility-associated-like protein